MKNLILMAVLMVGLISCNKPVQVAGTSVGDQNIEVVKKFIEAGVKGDTANLGSFMADKAMFYGPGLNDSSSRQQEIDFWKNSWKKDWASLEFERGAIVAFTLAADEKYPGDWVSDWGKWTVNDKNGKPKVSFHWNGVFRVKDGKIEVARAHYNINDFFTQQGFTITPPAIKGEEKKK